MARPSVHAMVSAGALAACAAWCAVAAAQPATGGGRMEPTRVEAGVGDVDGSRVSLRRLDTDLRQPSGFGGVYRFDRTDAFGVTSRSFMRIDGATHAIFPRSVYRDSAWGPIAEIPPGTVFHIGTPPELRAPAVAMRRPATMLDTSIDTRTRPEPPVDARGADDGRARDAGTREARGDEPRGGDAQPATIFGDERYRAARVEAVLQQALRAPAGER